jgi:hypothetical protein
MNEKIGMVVNMAMFILLEEFFGDQVSWATPDPHEKKLDLQRPQLEVLFSSCLFDLVCYTNHCLK